ncbi:TPA: hypothetical protein ACPHW8_000223 [Vibrio alginolyticus]
MNKKLTTTLLICLSLTSNVQADESLNTLSDTYDAKARYEMSENDVKSFIYQWFAAFDHQLESGYYLNRLTDSVQMQYPDSIISSKEDFLRWYKGVTDNIIWNAHSISGMKVSGNQQNGWNVSYDVNWKATTKDNQNYDLMVHQELRVIRVGDQLKLVRLKADIIK